LTGQVGDHPREHHGLLSVGQIYTGHEDHSADEQLDPVGRNCVAFCVAYGLDPLLSRVKPCLFGSCPRHSASFGNWRKF
jgi:hypothetical protein